MMIDVSDELKKLWYSLDDLSIISLYFREVDSSEDAERFIEDLKLLELQLKKEFKKVHIRNEKGGY